MEILSTFLNGALLIKPRIFKDERGYFFESYNQNSFASLGINCVFVQDNESFSTKGVLRGLHFQKPPYAQAKFIRVLEGEIEDIIVDLRQGSPSFGQWHKVHLKAEDNIGFFIPQGFAHGFLVLSPIARISYKCDNLYNKESEGGIKFDDEQLKIKWDFPKGVTPILSPKDTLLPSFEQYKAEPAFKYQP